MLKLLLIIMMSLYSISSLGIFDCVPLVNDSNLELELFVAHIYTRPILDNKEITLQAGESKNIPASKKHPISTQAGGELFKERTYEPWMLDGHPLIKDVDTSDYCPSGKLVEAIKFRQKAWLSPIIKQSLVMLCATEKTLKVCSKEYKPPVKAPSPSAYSVSVNTSLYYLTNTTSESLRVYAVGGTYDSYEAALECGPLLGVGKTMEIRPAVQVGAPRGHFLELNLNNAKNVPVATAIFATEKYYYTEFPSSRCPRARAGIAGCCASGILGLTNVIWKHKGAFKIKTVAKCYSDAEARLQNIANGYVLPTEQAERFSSDEPVCKIVDNTSNKTTATK